MIGVMATDLLNLSSVTCSVYAALHGGVRLLRHSGATTRTVAGCSSVVAAWFNVAA